MNKGILLIGIVFIFLIERHASLTCNVLTKGKTGQVLQPKLVKADSDQECVVHFFFLWDGMECIEIGMETVKMYIQDKGNSTITDELIYKQLNEDDRIGYFEYKCTVDPQAQNGTSGEACNVLEAIHKANSTWDGSAELITKCQQLVRNVTQRVGDPPPSKFQDGLDVYKRCLGAKIPTTKKGTLKERDDVPHIVHDVLSECYQTHGLDFLQPNGTALQCYSDPHSSVLVPAPAGNSCLRHVFFYSENPESPEDTCIEFDTKFVVLGTGKTARRGSYCLLYHDPYFLTGSVVCSCITDGCNNETSVLQKEWMNAELPDDLLHSCNMNLLNRRAASSITNDIKPLYECYKERLKLNESTIQTVVNCAHLYERPEPTEAPAVAGLAPPSKDASMDRTKQEDPEDPIFTEGHHGDTSYWYLEDDGDDDFIEKDNSDQYIFGSLFDFERNKHRKTILIIMVPLVTIVFGTLLVTVIMLFIPEKSKKDKNKSRSSTRKARPVNEKPDVLNASDFKQGGPLKVLDSVDGPLVHATDLGPKSKPISQRVELDTNLNQIFMPKTDTFIGPDTALDLAETQLLSNETQKTKQSGEKVNEANLTSKLISKTASLAEKECKIRKTEALVQDCHSYKKYREDGQHCNQQKKKNN